MNRREKTVLVAVITFAVLLVIFSIWAKIHRDNEMEEWNQIELCLKEIAINYCNENDMTFSRMGYYRFSDVFYCRDNDLHKTDYEKFKFTDEEWEKCLN